jgi:mRNA-degrading endonuclease RelE of RelBE toxin-antitoxin system
VYRIRFAVEVEGELRRIRPFYRTRILDAISRQLRIEPNIAARNRKLLRRLVAPWRSTAPVWELRVGEYRVFYDIDDEEPLVLVRAIRRKPQKKRTEDIL